MGLIFFAGRRQYDGVRRVSGSRREPVVSVENPTSRYSRREGRSLPREGRCPLFQFDVGISIENIDYNNIFFWSEDPL